MKKSLSSLAAASVAVSMAFSSVAFAAPVGFSQKEFIDVTMGSPHYAAIEYFRQNNLLKGYLDGTFKPGRRMTRAEFVMMMTNPLILGGTTGNRCIQTTTSTGMVMANVQGPFSDVAADAWYAEAVCVAKERGIINGYPDGTFKPNENISFVEAAKVASTVFAVQQRQDNPSDEKWYTVYVRNLTEMKAIPKSIKRFDQIMTRGEIAEIAFRLKTGTMADDIQTYENIAAYMNY